MDAAAPRKPDAVTTDRTLDYIPELKRRHGIDYDCHASYRFKERGES